MHFKNLIRTCLQGEFKCSMLSMNTEFQDNFQIEFVINAYSCNMCKDRTFKFMLCLSLWVYFKTSTVMLPIFMVFI